MAAHSTASTDALPDAKAILGALRALRKGDFAVRLPMDQTGMAGAIAEAFNDIAQQVGESTAELDRISVAVGKEGQIDQRLSLGGATGGWAARVHSVNSLIGDLVEPTLEVARVIGAVAQGDLSQKMTPAIDGRPLRGAFLWISDTVNTMVDQLGSFAAEVTRVAREVGTEGKLGGQAQVKGVAGTWKDLTDSVNSMAGNLTAQVRNIAAVTTAVANGDLVKRCRAKVEQKARNRPTRLMTKDPLMVPDLPGADRDVRDEAVEGLRVEAPLELNDPCMQLDQLPVGVGSKGPR